MSAPRIALQLFTVREELEEDYTGCLRQVSDLGYSAVQLTGNIPYSATEMRSILDNVGLDVAGMHVALEELEGNLSQWVKFSSTIGTDDLVCPFLPEERRRTREDWLQTAELLDDIGARCRDAGKRLSYHNHSFEFTRLDGAYALDLLYERTSPENLYAELDTYWVAHGGANPTDYIEKYAGRLPMLHLKDMADDEERSFAEVGSGILDWEAIHRTSLEAGVEWYIIEQDVCKQPPMESARESLEYLEELLGD
jgi:sugar phosphate isomerase/epimerase